MFAVRLRLVKAKVENDGSTFAQCKTKKSRHSLRPDYISILHDSLGQGRRIDSDLAIGFPNFSQGVLGYLPDPAALA